MTGLFTELVVCGMVYSDGGAGLHNSIPIYCVQVYLAVGVLEEEKLKDHMVMIKSA